MISETKFRRSKCKSWIRFESYTLGPRVRNSNTDFTLSNCLFGSVKLTKNADLDKYKYTGYGMGFDSCSEVLFTDGSYEKNIIIFGADMSCACW